MNVINFYDVLPLVINDFKTLNSLKNTILNNFFVS